MKIFCVQNGCELWAETGPFQSLASVEKAIFKLAQHKTDVYEWSEGQLRVNTSLFVW